MSSSDHLPPNSRIRGAIVHLTRRQDGVRGVSSISTVEGLNADAVELSKVFVLSGEAGTLVATGVVPRFHVRLTLSGTALPADLYVAPRA